MSACPFCGGELTREGIKKMCKECAFQAFPLRTDTIAISPRQVKQKLEKKEPFLLLDIRRVDEVETARIAEARWIPMDELPKRWKQLDPNQEIVCHCHHGTRGAYAANFLIQKGFKNVRNMEGGIDSWSRAIDERVARY